MRSRRGRCTVHGRSSRRHDGWPRALLSTALSSPLSTPPPSTTDYSLLPRLLLPQHPLSRRSAPRAFATLSLTHCIASVISRRIIVHWPPFVLAVLTMESSPSDRIRVSVRLRPLLDSSLPSVWSVDAEANQLRLQRDNGQSAVSLLPPPSSLSISALPLPSSTPPPPAVFQFDRVFPPAVLDAAVYEGVVAPLVEGAVSGLNGTVFAYSSRTTQPCTLLACPHHSLLTAAPSTVLIQLRPDEQRQDAHHVGHAAADGRSAVRAAGATEGGGSGGVVGSEGQLPRGVQRAAARPASLPLPQPPCPDCG